MPVVNAASASAVASSGNIGPGFDMLALALELRCRVTATPADEWSVRHVTEHAPPPDVDDLTLLAARAMVDRPLALVVENEIPLARGLGSSSAASAAGAAAALRAVEGGVDLERVYEHVAMIEGHADNAAAAVYGGLVGVTPDRHPIQLPLAPRWRVVVAIPPQELPTAQARAVLSDHVDRRVVVRSMSRLLVLLEGLRTGNDDVLRGATGDELHEAPRAGLFPRADALIAAAREAGAPHAAWSGAGPAIIAFVDGAGVGDVAVALRSTMGDGEVRVMDVATRGII